MTKKLLKKRRVQELWIWISLSINYSIVLLYLARQDAALLRFAVLLPVATICQGIAASRLHDDITAIVIKLVCLYIITFALGFKAASDLFSFSVLLALTIASFAEVLVFFIITYWHAIRRFFVQSKQRKGN